MRRSYYVAHARAVDEDHLKPEPTAVLFNCATGLKDPLPDRSERLNLARPPDFAAMRRRGVVSITFSGRAVDR